MQTLLVVIIIGCALFYLGKQFYNRFIKKEAHCDSCAFGPTIEK